VRTLFSPLTEHCSHSAAGLTSLRHFAQAAGSRYQILEYQRDQTTPFGPRLTSLSSETSPQQYLGRARSEISSSAAGPLKGNHVLLALIKGFSPYMRVRCCCYCSLPQDCNPRFVKQLLNRACSVSSYHQSYLLFTLSSILFEPGVLYGEQIQLYLTLWIEKFAIYSLNKTISF
jgi:hypothetical protein